MISVLAQERLLGAAVGSICTGMMIFEHRRNIYSLISENQPQYKPPPQEPILGKTTRVELAHLWNNTVDQTMGPVIAYLSSRGW